MKQDPHRGTEQDVSILFKKIDLPRRRLPSLRWRAFRSDSKFSSSSSDSDSSSLSTRRFKNASLRKLLRKTKRQHSSFLVVVTAFVAPLKRAKVDVEARIPFALPLHAVHMMLKPDIL